MFLLSFPTLTVRLNGGTCRLSIVRKRRLETKRKTTSAIEVRIKNKNNKCNRTPKIHEKQNLVNILLNGLARQSCCRINQRYIEGLMLC